jgi:protein-disulfide isomerase
MSFRNTLAAAGLTLMLLPITQIFAQAEQAQTQEQPSAPTPQAPAAQVPGAAPAAPKGPPPFPLVDRANFTATTPTEATVGAFLKASWGYDTNRLWQIQAIEKTSVPNLSKVVILVEEKGSQQDKPAALSFFVLPDGTHLIASEEVLPFGADPFAENRKMLESRANGPSRGAATKSLQFVEFSDFQCPHCKDAQVTIDRLLKDFPNAHFVYQNFPLTAIHPQALQAADYGTCVAKAGGNDAFFKYADNIFANQAKLTPEGSAEALKDAVTAAGQDPAKVGACAATPETKAAVDASLQLGRDLTVNQTPTLYVNGRGLPLGGIPYDTLKQIIEYQEQMDGVAAAK